MTKTPVQLLPARGEGTRRRLVAATIELVAEHGWDAVTTRQIARRAQVNQALINYHFGSKAALLLAALDDALREGFGAPVRALRSAPTFTDGAIGLMRELAAMDKAEPVVRFAMEAMARAPRDEQVRRVMADLLAELRTALAAGVAEAQDRGELSPDLDPMATATLLGAAFDGLGLHLLIDPTLDGRMAEAAVAAMLTTPRRNR